MQPAATCQHQEPELSIVVPVYRSEDCILPLFKAIDAALAKSRTRYELILVNDYSPDASWERILDLCRSHGHVVGVNLRKNFGQDAAIMAGLRYARGEIVAIMDDDLQHDPADICRMIESMRKKNLDLVYANFEVKQQSAWKNLGSWFNGKVAEIVLKKPRDVYLSPFKVIHRSLLRDVLSYVGPYPYVDGLLFQHTAYIGQISAEHRRRHAGRGNYSIWRSIRVWTRLAFGFSVFPLRLMGVCGLLMSMGAFLLAIDVVISRLYDPTVPVGWASQVLVPLFLGGVQTSFLGLLGEYLGRTFLSVSMQPQSSVRNAMNCHKESSDLQTGLRVLLDNRD